MTRYSIWNAPSDLDYYQQNEEPPIEPTVEEAIADAMDAWQQLEDAADAAVLEVSRWQREQLGAEAAKVRSPIFVSGGPLGDAEAREEGI